MLFVHSALVHLKTNGHGHKNEIFAKVTIEKLENEPKHSHTVYDN